MEPTMYRTRVISDRRVEIILAENTKLRNQVKALSAENERIKTSKVRQSKETQDLIQRLLDILEKDQHATNGRRKLHE